MQDQPQENKIYALTGGTGDQCISNGSTWKESEVKLLIKYADQPLFDADGLTQKGIVEYGKLRSSGMNENQATEKVIAMDKAIPNLTKAIIRAFNFSTE